MRVTPELQISQLDQGLPTDLELTVPEFVAGGLARLLELREEFRQRSEQELDARGLRELEALQQRIDALDAWQLEPRVEAMISDLGLPAERRLGELSGGWRRRVALAQLLEGSLKAYDPLVEAAGISDMIRRLDSYSTARARDLRESGDIGGLPNNIRRLFSRFFKCYVMRKGYREGGYGLLVALFAGLFPLLSHLKARLEKD